MNINWPLLVACLPAFALGVVWLVAQIQDWPD